MKVKENVANGGSSDDDLPRAMKIRVALSKELMERVRVQVQ